MTIPKFILANADDVIFYQKENNSNAQLMFLPACKFTSNNSNLDITPQDFIETQLPGYFVLPIGLYVLGKP